MEIAVDLAAWLRDLGLTRYEQRFRASDIGTDILADLTERDLEELGISRGDRKKLLEAIAALRAQACAGAVELGAGDPAAHPGAALVESHGERRQLTLLFCDLVGSTELSRLDPEDLGGVIHAYQQCCRRVIRRWDGHVANYTGDRVLAYFGWPRAHEDDVERAVRGGLELIEAVGRLRAERVPLAARVGIATGLVMVGDLIGPGAAKEEAVFGETPNLAARLQTLAEPGSVVVADGTRALLGGLFEYRELGMQRLKGFAEPVRCWQVIAERATSRFEALHGARLTPLVGREEEINLLLQRWEQARDGEGQVVLLSGEPGIGKSRIALGLLEALADQALLRLRYQCSQFHSQSALHPVLEHMARAAGIEEADPADRKLAKLKAVLCLGVGQIEEAVLLLAPLLSIPIGGRAPPPQLSAERRRNRIREIFLEQLEGLAARQPLLMLFEDAQWIDPSTSELLGLAIERIHKLPILLLVTFRSEFAPPWRGRNVTALSLVGLSRRQILTMVDWVTDAKSLPAEVLERIVERTDGVPLFVEELTKTVLESGLLADLGDRYELAGPPPPLAIPATLHDSLVARLDRLAPVREMAQIGAVIGRDFSHELLAAVVDRPGTELRTALDPLVSSGLVFRRGTPLEATYCFKHALVRDAAYSTLLSSRRRQLHARIAGVLEERFPETANTQPELLAHHCRQAGLMEQAVDYWTKAGQQSLARSATLEAVAHLSEGLKALRSLPESPERDRRELDLQVALARAQFAAKGSAAAETGEAYTRARELCERIGDTQQLFPVLWGLTVFHVNCGEPGAGRAIAEEMLRLAEGQDDVAAQVASHRALSAALYHLGEWTSARRHLERVILLYDALPQRPPLSLYANDHRAMALAFLAPTLFALGYPDQARARCREALAYGKGLAHPHSLGLVLDELCRFHSIAHEWETVQDLAQALVTLSTEQGFSYWLAGGHMSGGCALAELGQLQEGLALYHRGSAVRRVGYPLYLGLLADAHHRAGEREEALRLLTEVLDRVKRTGESWFEPELHRRRGEVLSSLPARDPVGAETCFRRAIGIARGQSAKMFELRAAVSLARLWAEQGRRAEAHELLAPVYGWFTEGFDTSDLKHGRALLDQLA
jgi:predicted ATPase/class 3 adenylate cyclase